MMAKKGLSSFARHALQDETPRIVLGDGAYLHTHTVDGRRVIDAVSSWWP
jgi:adenosylmethionine-8-amino-7-oxononanoate aminotransferase